MSLSKGVKDLCIILRVRANTTAYSDTKGLDERLDQCLELLKILGSSRSKSRILHNDGNIRSFNAWLMLEAKG